MSHVNPPPQLRIPDRFFQDKELRSFFEQQHRILFQLWNRTGGPDDAIAEIQTSEVYDHSLGAIGEDELAGDEFNYYPERQYRSVTVTQSMTANAFDFLAVTQNATIDLPEYPDADDVVTVLNVNGKSVTVSGNGNLINGETETVSTRKNTTINYQYFADLSAWYMR